MHYPPDTSGQFLALSSVLTGFSTTELQATGVTDQLWATLENIIGAPIMGEMLSFTGSLFAKCDTLDDLEASLEKHVMGRCDDKGVWEVPFHPTYGPIAQRIIGLWYTGVWSPMPSAWNDVHGGITNDGTFVVSPAAYKAGLVWPAFGSHPRSARADGYGSWGAPPLFEVNTDPPKQ